MVQVIQYGLILITLGFGLIPEVVFGQVCSAIGTLCTRTTDCCKGCCEAHVCVDRPFSCSPDMIAQPGYETCERFSCPPGHICFLREVCPPENPCPRAPGCRRVDVTYNYTDYRYYRNSATSGPLKFHAVTFKIFMVQFLMYIFFGK